MSEPEMVLAGAQDNLAVGQEVIIKKGHGRPAATYDRVEVIAAVDGAGSAITDLGTQIGAHDDDGVCPTGQRYAHVFPNPMARDLIKNNGWTEVSAS